MSTRHARHRAAIMRKRSAGQSELISGGFARIVVAIAILAGIGYAVSQIMSANSDAAQAEIENIDTLVTKQFGNLGVYTGLTTASVIGTGHLSSNYYSGQQILTPWHGVIIIAPTSNTYTGVANGAWQLGMPTVPAGECNDLAVEHFTGQITLAIGSGSSGSTSMPTGTASGTGGLTYAPPTPAQAVTACGGASTGTGGTSSASGMASMVLTFGGN